MIENEVKAPIDLPQEQVLSLPTTPSPETTNIDLATPVASEPKKSSNTKFWFIVIIIFIVVGAVSWLAKKQPKTADDESSTLLKEVATPLPNSAGDDPFASESDSSSDPGLEETYISFVDASSWAPFMSSETTPELLALTKENFGEVHPVGSTLVPAVLEEGIFATQVYTDFGQTILTVPKGWYGEDGSEGSGLFRDYEHKVLLRLAFTDMGEPISSLSRLREIMSSNESVQAAGLQDASQLVFENLSENQLLTNLTGGREGGIYIIYTLNPAKPNFVHKTAISAHPTTTLSTTEIEELVKMITKSEQIIGIDPKKPNERTEFLEANNLGSWQQ